jgi:5-methylcytosine-specific restriction endonuclease McrA
VSEIRTCRTCRQTRAQADFPKDRPDGSRHHRCLDCQAAAHRDRYHADSKRRALQIAYSMNGSVRRRFPEAPAVPADRLAAMILEADACAYCGVPNDREGRGFQLDHVQPLSQGGEHSLDNLSVACARCNRAKWDQSLSEFHDWLDRVLARRQQTVS